jgi:uncharacterized protein
MPQGSTTFHESEERLRPQTRDMHRAIVSLMEELEAIDWYQQRMDAVEDSELREILRHNRDEEQEHAAMVLEWIRRQDAGFDTTLREYLFKEGNIVAQESAGGNGNGATRNGGSASGVGIGSLRRAGGGESSTSERD